MKIDYQEKMQGITKASEEKNSFWAAPTEVRDS